VGRAAKRARRFPSLRRQFGRAAARRDVGIHRLAAGGRLAVGTEVAVSGAGEAITSNRLVGVADTALLGDCPQPRRRRLRGATDHAVFNGMRRSSLPRRARIVHVQ
jgi:hypothetical protein